MGTKKLFAVVAGLAAGAMALTACTPPATQPPSPTESGSAAPADTSVSVMWNQPLFSLNDSTTFGNATANANVLYLTQDTFTYYDKGLNIVANDGYGTYEKTSDDPLTVKLTLADTANWSDGVPVTSADMILSYGAISGLFNTVSGDDATALYNEDGTLKPNDAGSVYFDTSDPGMALITDFPTIDGDKSITTVYSKPFADWEQQISSFGSRVPAHIVAKRALGIDDPTEGKQAIVDAFKNKDADALSKISNVWNTDWNVTSMPSDADLLIHSGPYGVTDYAEAQYLTVTKDANYKGKLVPQVNSITIRYNEDPMAAVQALENGEVQLISPQATADVLTAVQGIQGVSVYTGDEGTYEHVDLTFNNKGPFDPATYGGDKEKASKVRQAFLMTIPRQAIIDNIIKPINPNAAVRNSFTTLPTAPSYAQISGGNGMASKYDSADADAAAAAAKKLLDDAGVKQPVKVRFLYGASNVRRQQEFRLIKDIADNAGFEVIDGGDDNWGSLLGSGTYDVSLFGWQSESTAVTESDANYRTGGPNNYGGYSNKEVDKLYDQLQTTTDPAEQANINTQIETALVNDNFGVTIFQFPGVTAYSSTLSGIDPVSISPTIFWNFWEWTVSA